MAVEQWLLREVARGLQGLVALRLPGAPADDSITLTLDIWLAALEVSAAGWTEAQDVERIRAGFKTLYRTCDRWPAPRHFLDHLGNRDPPKALPPPRLSPEERARNKARLQALMKQLGAAKNMFSGEKRDDDR